MQRVFQDSIWDMGNSAPHVEGMLQMSHGGTSFIIPISKDLLIPSHLDYGSSSTRQWVPLTISLSHSH